MVAGGEVSGFLLDSSVIVAAFNEESRVLERLRQIPTGQIFVPVVALGELHFGASKSRRTEANTRRIEEFTEASNVVDVDTAVARFYGRIRDELRRAGRPIPENDIWIAAIALRRELVLTTRDAHFDHVNGL